MSANPRRRWTNHIRPWAPTAATFAPPLVSWERHRVMERRGGKRGKRGEEETERSDGEKREGDRGRGV